MTKVLRANIRVSSCHPERSATKKWCCEMILTAESRDRQGSLLCKISVREFSRESQARILGASSMQAGLLLISFPRIATISAGGKLRRSFLLDKGRSRGHLHPSPGQKRPGQGTPAAALQTGR